MRHRGRLVALATICAGALWFAAGPAFAVTLSVGGSATGATISLGDGPSAVGVNGPSTAVAVEAAPSGAQVSADTPLTPPLHVSVPAPKLDQPLPISPFEPAPTDLPQPAPVDAPTVGVSAPTQSVAPVSPRPGMTPSTPKSAPDVGSNPYAGVSPTTRAISAVGYKAGERSSDVTASIASGSDAGVLSAFRSTGARLMLWIALAALVLAMRLFAGAATSKTLTSKAARAG